MSQTLPVPPPVQSPSACSDNSPLLVPSAPQSSYGTVQPESPFNSARSRRILLVACLRMAAVFIVSCMFLGGTLWLALPTLDPVDRNDLRIPKSFVELQALNTLLKKYRDVYPIRILVCYVVVYFFLQAFSLPGSMYLSILAGAVWGVPVALPLACACVATGATLCYLISAALGPALLTLPSWRARLETWSVKVADQRENLIPFLILIRLAPFPPHWVVNVLCPHVGIGIPVFWASTFLGILGVSIIHTRIGQTLDEMTSAKDFNLISWKNFFGLAAIVVGVLIPVGFRFYFQREAVAADVTEIEAERRELLADDEESRVGGDIEDTIVIAGPRMGSKRKNTKVTFAESSEDEGSSDSEDSEDDIVLQVGPSVDPVHKDVEVPVRVCTEALSAAPAV